MTRTEAITKVAKLFRLGRSSNPHEAAAALRQAQALMERHSISQAELPEDASESIGEHWVRCRGMRPPVYGIALANLVSEAFGLRHFLRECAGPRPRAHLIFVGAQTQAEIGAYTYAVLLRQLERDRCKHLKRVKLPRNRAARGDLFGLGWVSAVREQVQRFAGRDDHQRIQAHIEHRFGPLQHRTRQARSNASVRANDAHAGRVAGQRARLHPAPAQRLEVPA